MKPDEILAVCTSLGSAVGVTAGIIFDQLVWGLIFGPSLGLVLGGVLAERARAKAKSQE